MRVVLSFSYYLFNFRKMKAGIYGKKRRGFMVKKRRGFLFIPTVEN